MDKPRLLTRQPSRSQVAHQQQQQQQQQQQRMQIDHPFHTGLGAMAAAAAAASSASNPGGVGGDPTGSSGRGTPHIPSRSSSARQSLPGGGYSPGQMPLLPPSNLSQSTTPGGYAPHIAPRSTSGSLSAGTGNAADSQMLHHQFQHLSAHSPSPPPLTSASALSAGGSAPLPRGTRSRPQLQIQPQSSSQQLYNDPGANAQYLQPPSSPTRIHGTGSRSTPPHSPLMATVATTTASTQSSSSSGHPRRHAHAANEAGASGTSSESTTANGVPKVYLNKFLAPDFKPESYLNETIGSLSAPSDVRAFKSALDESKRIASRTLQKSIAKNHPQFISVAREIAHMEADLQVMRGWMSKIREIGEDIIEDFGAGSSTSGTGGSGSMRGESAMSRRRTMMRASVVDQQGVYRQQLQRLWNTIEGSQQMLPFAPSRHVLGEFHGLKEISPATYQVMHTVALIVLNDHVLIAIRNRHNRSARPVLVADKCWKLADVILKDMRNSAQITSAIRIERRRESVLLFCGTPETKREVIELLTKAINMSSMPETSADANGRGGQMFPFGNPMDMPPMPDMPPLPGTNGIPPLPGSTSATSPQATPSHGVVIQPVVRIVRETPVAPQGSEGSASSEGSAPWLRKTCIDLDVYIDHREFEAAVDLVAYTQTVLADKEKTTNLTQNQRTDFAELASRLTKAIISTMMLPSLSKRQYHQNVKWLLQLGKGAQARELFLISRSNAVRHRTRQLKLEGSTSVYVRELAVVFFRLVRNTCEWYADLFVEPGMSSTLVGWIQQEVAAYADIFRRQVFDAQPKLQIVAACLRSTQAEIDIMGSHAGLDLQFILDHELFPDLVRCVLNQETKCRASVAQAIAKDKFTIARVIQNDENSPSRQVLGERVLLVQCVLDFDSIMMGFLSEVQYIIHQRSTAGASESPLYSQVVASVTSLIESFLRDLLTITKSSNSSDHQCFAIIVNAKIIVEWVIPRIIYQLEKIFKRKPTDIFSLKMRLDGFPANVQEVFCQRRALELVKTRYDFATVDYAFQEAPTAAMRPSPGMIGLVQDLDNLGGDLAGNWPSISVRSILSSIIDAIFFGMAEARAWERRSTSELDSPTARESVISPSPSPAPSPSPSEQQQASSSSTATATASAGKSSSSNRRVFGCGGVHLLILDIHFFLKTCGGIVSSSTSRLAHRLCEKALRMFLNSNAANNDVAQRGWFDERVADALREAGREFFRFSATSAAATSTTTTANASHQAS